MLFALALTASLHWTQIVQHLDWTTRTHVVRTERHIIPIAHPQGQVIGTWTRTVQRSPHVRVTTIYPRYAPKHPVTYSYTTWMSVTGYAPGCGDSGRGTSSGSTPTFGTVASSVLPYGTHVTVPSLGFSGVVLDTGAPLDIWEPSCDLTYGLTGWREVIVTR